jgi:uncharacterized membrane protein YccC
MTGDTSHVDTQELLTHLDRRFADGERAAHIRHTDLVRRVERLDTEIVSARERLSEHDSHLETLKVRFKEFTDNMPLTRLDAKYIISTVVATVLATVAFLKFLGRI